jgi:hypothetical protein
VIIQIFEIILVSAIIVFVFATFNVKLNLTLAIASMALIGPCFDIFKSLERTLFNFAYYTYQKGINVLRI